MANKGWISIHRKILDDPIFQNEKLFKVWMYCLLKASHSDREQIVGLKVVNLKVGEFIFGRKASAKELNMSESTVWRYIKLLEKMGNITLKSNNKFSVISVINWKKYQNEKEVKVDSTKPLEHQYYERYHEQQMNNKWTTNEQQMDTNNNVDNVDNVNNDDDIESYVTKINNLIKNKVSSSEINNFLKFYETQDLDLLIKKIEESKYLQENINFNRLGKKFITKVYNDDYKDFEEIKRERKNTFNNFKQITDDYSEDELEDMAMRKQMEAFKNLLD